MIEPNSSLNTFIVLTEEEQRIRTYLINFAHNTNYKIRPYVFYRDLCSSCYLSLDMANNPNDRLIIGEYLGNISLYEIYANRPVLSSLVVSTNYEQGDGFYKLCAEVFPKLGSWTKQKRERIDIKMTEECISFWNIESNYKSFKSYMPPTDVSKIVLSPEEEALKTTLVNAASQRETLFYSELVETTDDYHIEKLTKYARKNF